MNVSPETDPYQYERLVGYVVKEGNLLGSSLERKKYKWNPVAVMSDEIPYISDRRLRLALELADIVQALDFPNPDMGGFPGGVTVVPATRSYSEVYSDFSDDTYDRLKQWLHENYGD